MWRAAGEAPQVNPKESASGSAAPAAKARTKAKTRPRRRPRRFSDPGRTWAKGLERRRPGLVPFVLERLADRYGRPVWERRLDPTSELILTILTQNSADINAERAFESLRAAFPSGGVVEVHALHVWTVTSGGT